MKKILIIFIAVVLYNTLIAQEHQQLLTLKNNLLVNLEVDQVPQQVESFSKKSPGLAILYSVLLPGMGELYAGDYSTGKYFTIADGVIWGVFAGMSIYGSNKEDDYRAFAKSYGGVNLNGKDDAYFANIGIYENIDQYNTEKELNREFDEVYNTDTHYWAWGENDERTEYRGLWISSENAKNNIRFAAGALVLNRIISAIFAVRAVSAYNKRESNSVSWEIDFGIKQTSTLPSSLVMNFHHNF